jgi:prevent-host-death family protein
MISYRDYMSKVEKIVGVREVRARMSAYLRAVTQGESITIADRRKKPIARLVPAETNPEREALRRLGSLGAITLGVGRPGRNPPIRLRRKGRLLSDMVVEDRR